MWGLIDDKSVSEAKRLGHEEVTPGHIAFCLAQALERRGVENLPAASAEIAASLPVPTHRVVTPKLSDDSRTLLNDVTDEESALRVLTQILAKNDWKAPGAPVAEESLVDVMADLESLIGLDSVKAEVSELVALQQVGAVRAQAGLPDITVGLHMVFTGDPGTGKTTVARLVSRIYRALGLLSRGHIVEVGRADLVGEYVGHTAPKVRAAFDKAEGGVLFIDEAYALTPTHGNDFAPEALAALVMEMENRRANLAVIVAGYDEPMRRFLETNEGMQSRFQTYIDFPDYTPEELLRIWQVFAEKAQIDCSEEVLAAVSEHLASTKTSGPAGNGRYVRKLFEESYRRMAARAAADKDIELWEVTAFTVDDIPKGLGDREESMLGLYL
jgi:SpoVK/Ycf46/Vps4 family AAA+-type ATPase